MKICPATKTPTASLRVRGSTWQYNWKELNNTCVIPSRLVTNYFAACFDTDELWNIQKLIKFSLIAFVLHKADS